MNRPTQATQTLSSDTARFTLLGHIFGSHIERVGVTRTLAGGLSMYLCIPFLVAVHLTVAVMLYQWILRPLLGTKRIYWRDYIIIDRHRYQELTWFDKFNCMFCGYANGLCTMLNIELDQAAAHRGKLNPLKKLALAVTFAFFMPLWLVVEAAVQIIYNILVSRPLGMHRVSRAEMRELMDREGYAKGTWPVMGFCIRTAKSTAARFMMALEQIESSWCPLTHFERRKGVVYPKHHDKFFGPNELEQMRETLRTRGTVSDRLPKY